MSHSKRSTFLVDPQVQWAIGRRIVLHWFLFAVCLVLVNIMMRTIVTITEVPFLEALRTAAVGQLSVVVIMIVMLPMFLLDTMKMSNRFAGPMYRLRQALNRLNAGEPIKPLAFRAGDFWSDAAEDFNRVAQQHDQLRRRNAELECELQSLRDEREMQPA
ncbi:MAG: hypothetical protein ACO1RT_08430 [Planctomycetaceae bacterium]